MLDETSLHRKIGLSYLSVIPVSLCLLSACSGSSGNNPPANHAPTTTSLSATTSSDISKTIQLQGSDIDNDPLTYRIASNPAHGSVTLNGNEVIYTPASHYTGEDSFTYEASDGVAVSAPATVSITVTAVNQTPVAGNLSTSTTVNVSKVIQLQGSDADNDALTYQIVSNPAHGSVTLNGSSASYTPANNYTGGDSFTYKVSDGVAVSAPATVSISVTTVNQAPVASNLSTSTTANVSKVIQLQGSDADNDALTYQIISNPAHGSVTLNGSSASYTPTNNYTGGDSFTYKASDGVAASSPATVTITVNAAPSTPLAKLNDTGVTTCGDYAFTANGSANGHSGNSDVSCALTSDADGDAVPQGQDGQQGRDYLENDDSDGHAGFSFTKLDNAGNALSADASQWSCVKDNVTGLIWEVKTDNGGLHDKDWQYSWYNPDTKTNGGDAGTHNSGACQYSDCDTQSFVNAVNAQGWCGANNWRMPSINELQSIVDHSRHDPAIDTNFFPTVIPWVYWTATPVAYPNDNSRAWFIGFNGGNDNPVNGKSVAHYVMLVRTGK